MKSVMTAYLILILHVILLVGLGLVVFFFRGIVHYMPWIVLGGLVAILGSGYWFFRRMKAQGRNLRETLNSPLFRDKTVEVSLFGGLAQFRIGRSSTSPLLDHRPPEEAGRIEWSGGDTQVQELTELARMLKSGLITRDEYEKAKRKIFRT